MYLDHLQRVSSHFVSSEVSYSVDSYPNLDHSYSVYVSLYPAHWSLFQTIQNDEFEIFSLKGLVCCHK